MDLSNPLNLASDFLYRTLYGTLLEQWPVLEAALLVEQLFATCRCKLSRRCTAADFHWNDRFWPNCDGVVTPLKTLNMKEERALHPVL